jgi:hypothetical protein
MAKKTTTQSTKSFLVKTRKKRPGIHSKKNHSTNKKSRNYKKSYRGQGR